MWYWKVWFDLIWFDLIWFDLIWFDLLDIPNLTENNIHYGWKSFFWTADIQATSTFHFISFPRFRCSCSRKIHSKKVEIYATLEKTAFLSLMAWCMEWGRLEADAFRNGDRKYSIVGICLFEIIRFLTMWRGVLLRKQAINTDMYILNPLKDKSHFTITAGDPVEKDVFESLSTLIEIAWWVTSSESSNHVVLFIRIV